MQQQCFTCCCVQTLFGTNCKIVLMLQIQKFAGQSTLFLLYLLPPLTQALYYTEQRIAVFQICFPLSVHQYISNTKRFYSRAVTYILGPLTCSQYYNGNHIPLSVLSICNVFLSSCYIRRACHSKLLPNLIGFIYYSSFEITSNLKG